MGMALVLGLFCGLLLERTSQDHRVPLCRDNGKEKGNYYSILGLYRGIMEKKMVTIWVILGLYRG